MIHATPPFSRAKSRELSPPDMGMYILRRRTTAAAAFFNEFLAGAIIFDPVPKMCCLFLNEWLSCGFLFLEHNTIVCVIDDNQ